MPASDRELDARQVRAAEALMRAVGKYVMAHGGNVAVAGPVQCQEWPGDRAGQFTIAVKCLGRKPTYAVALSPKESV